MSPDIFYDQEEQITNPTVCTDASNRELDKDIFSTLHHVSVDDPSSYLRSFLSIQEHIDAGNINQNIEIGIDADNRPDGKHARRYNLQTSNEVAFLCQSLCLGGDRNDLNRMV